MALNLSIPETHDLRPRITVLGVGGAGGNAVNNMIEQQLEGAEFVVANTDAQALAQSKSPTKLQLGVRVTEGLGAGARPEVGAAAAEESIEEIIDRLQGAHMCFITAGMGGGTGTGAAPIIARAARELGILTVGVVTKPFQFEGARRMRQAEEGLAALQAHVDTLIIIPNQNLFRLANEKTTFTEAFMLADDVLYQGVKGVTDLMVRPGIINLDFADIRSVMDEMGKAMMGTGEASGEDRAVQAAEKAIANPLLDEISLKGAKGVLINVTGGPDLTLFELDEAANRIRSEVDPDANIIVGSTLDPAMDGIMRVSVVATGIDAQEVEQPQPARRPITQAAAPAPVQPAETRDSAARSAMGPIRRPDAPERAPEAAQEPIPAAPRVAAQPAASDSHHAAPAARADMVEPRLSPAPPPRMAGEPSPEALRRLQAAVEKIPERTGDTARPRLQADTRSGRDEERSQAKFAINNLISRMTGTGRDDQPAPRPLRQPPQPAARSDADEGAPRDRSDIPAFLRRQAN